MAKYQTLTGIYGLFSWMRSADLRSSVEVEPQSDPKIRSLNGLKFPCLAEIYTGASDVFSEYRTDDKIDTYLLNYSERFGPWGVWF